MKNVLKFNELSKGLSYQLNMATKMSRDSEDYLVVPAVLIKEMVLHGEQGYTNGPEYVPAKEISKTAKTWNKIPVTLNHPTEGSAQDVLDDIGIGFVENAKWEDGKLKGDVWLSVKDLKKMGPAGDQILNELMENHVLELSTGYYADSYQIKGHFEGQQYQGIQTNIKPDHLAILPYTSGACSVDTGCGLNRENVGKVTAELAKDLEEFGVDNSSVIDRIKKNAKLLINRITKGDEMNKKERAALIKKLVENEAVTLSKEELEKSSDCVLNQFKSLVESQTAVQEEDPDPEPVKLTKGDIASALGVDVDALDSMIKGNRDRITEAEAKKSALVKHLVENQVTGMSEDELKKQSIAALEEFKRLADPVQYGLRGVASPSVKGNEVPDAPAVLFANEQEEPSGKSPKEGE